MNPYEHYARAMQLVEQAADTHPVRSGSFGERTIADLLAEAQVHATLALSAGQLDKPRTPTQRLYDATVNCAGQAADPDDEFVRAVES
jgi:hypothetical protein